MAAFGANNATPRVWLAAEIALVRDVAERTWEAVERARAEAALREREYRLRLALDASEAGSWTWDARTNQIDWDDGFRARYGFASDEPADVSRLGCPVCTKRTARRCSALLDDFLQPQ